MSAGTSPLDLRVALGGTRIGTVVGYRMLGDRQLLYCLPDDAAEKEAAVLVPLLVDVRPDGGLAQAAQPVDMHEAIALAHRVAAGVQVRQPVGFQLQQLSIAVVAMAEQIKAAGAPPAQTRPEGQ